MTFQTNMKLHYIFNKRHVWPFLNYCTLSSRSFKERSAKMFCVSYLLGESVDYTKDFGQEGTFCLNHANLQCDIKQK